jgi:high-affinity nickel permease
VNVAIALNARALYFSSHIEIPLPSVGALTMLVLGPLFGFKHATDVDHVVAVSTIVSEYRSVWRSALVGALWGAGHTASLFIVGMFV